VYEALEEYEMANLDVSASFAPPNTFVTSPVSARSRRRGAVSFNCHEAHTPTLELSTPAGMRRFSADAQPTLIRRDAPSEKIVWGTPKRCLSPVNVVDATLLQPFPRLASPHPSLGLPVKQQAPQQETARLKRLSTDDGWSFSPV
jgi:hypothetical protein